MDGHASANPLRRSLPGADRVKPERNLGAAKLPLAKSETNLRPSWAQVTDPPYADPHVRWCGREEPRDFPLSRLIVSAGAAGGTRGGYGRSLPEARLRRDTRPGVATPR